MNNTITSAHAGYPAGRQNVDPFSGTFWWRRLAFVSRQQKCRGTTSPRSESGCCEHFAPSAFIASGPLHIHGISYRRSTARRSVGPLGKHSGNQEHRLDLAIIRLHSSNATLHTPQVFIPYREFASMKLQMIHSDSKRVRVAERSTSFEAEEALIYVVPSAVNCTFWVISAFFHQQTGKILSTDGLAVTCSLVQSLLCR
jgi:hypothetical protein